MMEYSSRIPLTRSLCSQTIDASIVCCRFVATVSRTTGRCRWMKVNWLSKELSDTVVLKCKGCDWVARKNSLTLCHGSGSRHGWMPKKNIKVTLRVVDENKTSRCTETLCFDHLPSSSISRGRRCAFVSPENSTLVGQHRSSPLHRPMLHSRD